MSPDLPSYAELNTLKALASTICKDCGPPAIARLAESAGISTGTTHRHLQRLVKLGLVLKRPGQRGYSLTKAGKKEARG